MGRLLFVLLLWWCGLGDTHRFARSYQYTGDDSSKKVLLSTKILDDKGRVVLSYTPDSADITQYFYDDTMLVKEERYAPLDSVIIRYYHDASSRLKIVEERNFNKVVPFGYGIGQLKGCVVDPSEITYEWYPEYNCNYYDYDNRGNLILDSFYRLVDCMRVGEYTTTRYLFSADYAQCMVATVHVSASMNDGEYYAPEHDTVYRYFFANGYVTKTRYGTDSLFFKDGRLVLEKKNYDFYSHDDESKSREWMSGHIANDFYNYDNDGNMLSFRSVDIHKEKVKIDTQISTYVYQYY